MSERGGVYVRYGIEKHRHIVDAFPELGDVLFRETYEEASADARALVLTRLGERSVDSITWVHQPHQEGSSDPLSLFGSWGWWGWRI